MLNLTFDRVGFPMAKAWRAGSFHLWPVTKCQFKQFISETGRFDEPWYQTLLKENPEVPVNQCRPDNYEGLFMTGVFPEEALAFAQWLGEEYDLPTDKEWALFYQEVQKHFLPFRLSPYATAPEALSLGKQLGRFLEKPEDFSFVNNGVVEWVKNHDDFAADKFIGKGSPRDSFFPNVWNPLEDIVKLIDISERVFYFGFRLIKRPKKLESFF